MPARVNRPAAEPRKGKRPPLVTDVDSVPVVSEKGGIRTLHFGADFIQSQMVMKDPNLLALAYTRTMMAFELFLPAPRTIALLGLGGGSIAKWCYRHYPNARLIVVEINPHVIAVREAFGIPPNSRKFRILCQDGAQFVAEQRNVFDVLLVDCFTTDRLPAELCSQQFYDHCKASLTENGIMVANLCWQKHTRIVSRMRKSFDGKILLSSDGDGNTVVFACKGEQLWPKGEDEISLRPKLKKFARKHRLGRAVAPGS